VTNNFRLTILDHKSRGQSPDYRNYYYDDAQCCTAWRDEAKAQSLIIEKIRKETNQMVQEKGNSTGDKADAYCNDGEKSYPRFSDFLKIFSLIGTFRQENLSTN